MKKWICKIFLVLAAVFVISPVFRADASAASYKLINASEYNKSSERKVGGRTFEIQYNNGRYSLYATYNGFRHVLAVDSNMDYSIVTNGKTVYFGTHNYTSGKCNIYKVQSDGDGITVLYSFKSPAGFNLCGYYSGKLYYAQNKTWDYTTLKTYTIKSGIVKAVLKNAGCVKQSGRYFYLTPIRGDVAPLKLRVYNAKKGKTKTITKRAANYNIVGGKLYYAEYIKCDSTYGNSKMKIIRCSLTGSGKKTLIKSLKARAIYKYGTKSVKYYDYNNNMKSKKYQ